MPVFSNQNQSLSHYLRKYLYGRDSNLCKKCSDRRLWGHPQKMVDIFRIFLPKKHFNITNKTETKELLPLYCCGTVNIYLIYLVLRSLNGRYKRIGYCNLRPRNQNRIRTCLVLYIYLVRNLAI